MDHPKGYAVIILVALCFAACSKRAEQASQFDASFQEPDLVPVLSASNETKDPPLPLVLSSHETMFDPIDGRTINISVAAAALNGAVVLPGDVFSFNDRVGIRSASMGYKEAPVIYEGRKVKDLGGGVCQVSSTLHAAALFGQMETVERRPHSLVPKYVSPGYDATVAFPASCETGGPCGKIDLKIRNPYPVPIEIHAETGQAPDGKMKLSVSLLGHQRKECKGDPAAKESQTAVGVRREVAVFGKPSGYKKLIQAAAPGRVVWSSIQWHCLGEPDRTVKWMSVYPSVNEVWEIGKN